MREVELKSIVTDVEATRRRIEAAGAMLTFEGSLIDRRYSDAMGELTIRDHVLRLRIYEHAGKREGYLDWKGPTRYDKGYKTREELSTRIDDPQIMETILRNLGFVVVREIERTIAQYSIADAIVRFEVYPRMDPLVEIEGTPEAIESAIELTGLPRSGFNAGRLPDFILAFEQRTGERAAVSARELMGDYSYRLEDA